MALFTRIFDYFDMKIGIVSHEDGKKPDVADGVITEEGDHESLLAEGGVYRMLYETQFRRILDYETENGVFRKAENAD